MDDACDHLMYKSDFMNENNNVTEQTYIYMQMPSHTVNHA